MLNKEFIIQELRNMDSSSLALLIRDALDKAGVSYEEKPGTINFDSLSPADFEARDFTAMVTNTISEADLEVKSLTKYSFEPCATYSSKYDVSKKFASIDYTMVA